MTCWPDRPVAVRVPATSANLGPGFDSLGLALGLHDLVRAKATDGGLAIEVSGVGAGTARFGEDHLVVRAMRAAFDVIGGQPPGIWLRCENAIPQGFGLGSSAAAIVAGILAARALAGERGQERLPGDAVLQLAAGLEGHADNVAACLAGGLTISWTADQPDTTGTRFRVARLDPLPGLTAVLCVPSRPLATQAARRVLPATVPHADAARNAARTALLVATLTCPVQTCPVQTGSVQAREAGSGALAGGREALLAATQDFLHQSYRASSMPATASLVGALREAALPAVVSGAGPSALALVVPGVTAGPEAVAAIAAESGHEWAVHVLDVDRDGAVLLSGASP